MRVISNEHLDQLEAIIDEHELEGLMEAIAIVCSAKSDRICDEGWNTDGGATNSEWDGYAAGFLGASIRPAWIPFVEQS